MSDTAHTPGPWGIGQYDETLGYDAMTGGIRVGPVVIDGANYGQELCEPIEPEALARMMADAHIISAALGMFATLQEIANSDDVENALDPERNKRLARAALAKAKEPAQ